MHIAGHRAQFFGGNGQGDHDDEERVGLLTAPHGVELHPKEVAIAGEVVMVAKLGTAETSDTLSADPAASRVVEPWLLPEPLLPVAIRAASRNDEDKLAGALQRLVVEDSTVKLERAPGTEQLAAVDDGPGPPGPLDEPVEGSLRRQHHRGPDSGRSARDIHQAGNGPWPSRQAVRRAWTVCGLRHQGGTERTRRRIRVHR